MSHIPLISLRTSSDGKRGRKAIKYTCKIIVRSSQSYWVFTATRSLQELLSTSTSEFSSVGKTSPSQDISVSTIRGLKRRKRRLRVLEVNCGGTKSFLRTRSGFPSVRSDRLKYKRNTCLPKTPATSHSSNRAPEREELSFLADPSPCRPPSPKSP
jgi:hypothetical protein